MSSKTFGVGAVDVAIIVKIMQHLKAAEDLARGTGVSRAPAFALRVTYSHLKLWVSGLVAVEGYGRRSFTTAFGKSNHFNDQGS